MGVEPGLAGDEGTTAPTSSLQFKFSRVGHSCQPLAPTITMIAFDRLLPWFQRSLSLPG